MGKLSLFFLLYHCLSACLSSTVYRFSFYETWKKQDGQLIRACSTPECALISRLSHFFRVSRLCEMQTGPHLTSRSRDLWARLLGSPSLASMFVLSLASVAVYWEAQCLLVSLLRQRIGSICVSPKPCVSLVWGERFCYHRVVDWRLGSSVARTRCGVKGNTCTPQAPEKMGLSVSRTDVKLLTGILGRRQTCFITGGEHVQKVRGLERSYLQPGRSESPCWPMQFSMFNVKSNLKSTRELQYIQTPSQQS